MLHRIDSGVPPPVDVMPEGKRKYPWYEMAVGESFYVPGKNSAQLGAAYAQVQEKTDMRFTARKEGDGVRVWRIRLAGGLGISAAMFKLWAAAMMTGEFFPVLLGLT